MPAPSEHTTIQRPDLGMAVSEYKANGPTMGYIGLEVMPLLEVDEQAGQFPVIPKEALLTIPDTRRAMRGFYNRGDWEFEEGMYSTRINGWEEPLDDRERKLYRHKFDAELIAVMRATNIILRNQEKRIADKVFNTTNFTDHPVTVEWDNVLTATPIDDINKGKLEVRSQCGLLPNTLILSYYSFMSLRRCAQIIDLLKYTFPGADINSMSAQQLAAIFDVPRVLVGGAVYNSAAKGLNANIADLWDKEYAMLTITSASPDISEPCIGRTFLWTQMSANNTVVEEYRENQNDSDIYRVRHDTDERLLCSVDRDGKVISDIAGACSYLMSNISA